MDAARGLKPLKNDEGLALVMTALLMVALGAFLALAIDIGYMYVARCQLQTAADSAALAGSALLDPEAVNPFSQPPARNEAVNFARRNQAATREVEISSDGSNILSANNDVRLGNWNRNLSPKFDAERTPVNAVQVRARRTGTADAGGASAGGPVELFFAQMIAPRWATMATSATAVAERGPKAGFYLTIGRPVCSGAGTQVLAPANRNMAWTSLLNNSTNVTALLKDFCPVDKVPNDEICDGNIGKNIYTSNGTGNSLFQAAETDFFDPGYDGANKTYDAGGSVSTWTVVVPVVDVDDPTLQPGAQQVWGYARIVLTRACGTGNGTPCALLEGRTTIAPTGRCSNSENDIVISSITCYACSAPNIPFLSGQTALAE